MGDEILGNDLNIIDDLEIRWSLVTNGLNADAIKETLNGTDDSSLNTMLLNMPTNKCSNLKDFGDYLMHATKYSDILFKFNLVNTTRKWRFKRFVAKRKVILKFCLCFVEIKFKINLQVFASIFEKLKKFVVGFGNWSQSLSSCIKARGIMSIYLFCLLFLIFC